MHWRAPPTTPAAVIEFLVNPSSEREGQTGPDVDSEIITCRRLLTLHTTIATKTAPD